jgi:FixJ family two-component response regulator
MFALRGQSRRKCNGRSPRGALFLVRTKEPKLPRTAVIAIVDDDHSVREALTSLVRSLGYVAMAFGCAEDLLKSKRRRSMSCVITDVQMPGMTGLELHNRLVASGEPIPTILITAFPDERARERALQAGVICYLTKPFSEDDLLACIRSTLGRRKARGKGS